MNEKCEADVLTLCEEVWQWLIVESPELATFCAIHNFDDSWDDISEEAFLRREKKLREFLKKGEKIDTTTCTHEVALSHRLLIDNLKLYLEGLKFKSYLMPINYLEGIHNECNLTVSFMKFNTEDDFNKYISRLEKIPHKIDQVLKVLRQGVAEGVVPHSASVIQVPGQIDLMITTPLDKHELLKPFTVELPQVNKDKIEIFKLKAEDTLKDKVFPACIQLKDYLENEYFRHLRPKEGISSLRNGDQWYQQYLNFHLSCFMTPEQVHELGLKEIARIEKKIYELAEIEGLGKNFPEISAAIFKRQKNSFSSSEDVLEYVKDLYYSRIRPKIMQYFKHLPNIPMVIKTVPEFMKNAPLAFYHNGTPDGSRDGCFYINSYNLDDCYPFQLTTVALHEGEPGHHLQNTEALLATHLPNFRRYCDSGRYNVCPAKFGSNTAYLEGWGLYAEFLGEELNLYQNNLELLGRYSYESLRAARLVVDSGLHALGWSKEQAIQYMVDHTLASRSEVTKEVDRYITFPGQACGYKIGEIKIKELRQKAESRLGGKFDIKEFHHRILSLGRLPLRIIETVVDQYIHEVETSS